MKELRSASVFKNYYKERNIFKAIKRFFRKLKWAYQRATKGYCEFDVWDMSMWFIDVVPNMLEDLANNGHGYPGNSQFDTFEKWSTYLKDLADKFRQADEDYCEERNLYEDEFNKRVDEALKQDALRVNVFCDDDFSHNYFKEEVRIQDVRNGYLDEAFENFRKVFWELWD